MADWAWFDAHASPGSPKGLGFRKRPHAWATLANSGDGIAFRVVVRGEHCDAVMIEQRPGASSRGTGRAKVEVLPVARPGDMIEVDVACTLEAWERAAVVITWIPSPTWKSRPRTLRAPLKEIAECPEPRGVEA